MSLEGLAKMIAVSETTVKAIDLKLGFYHQPFYARFSFW